MLLFEHLLHIDTEILPVVFMEHNSRIYIKIVVPKLKLLAIGGYVWTLRK
jgi:hypothetical protein